ncbi:MAG: PKD domain-containing protein, partial [Flavitalea sp.]
MSRMLFIITSILSFLSAHSQQPIAAFAADNVSGCAPLTVKFIDQSAGAPTNWSWDFGNGQLLSNKNNTITYSQPGIYSVKLVVRNANGINSIIKTNFIEVKAVPVVDFIVNKVSGCSNASFHFTDQSTVAGGVINSWLWDFGDGQTSNTNAPDHIYTAEAIYNVTLTVGTSIGCNTTLTKFNFLQVVPGVKADFSNTNPISCNAPFQVAYTNLSTGLGTISYAWNLGNGTSSAASPSATYNTAGDYTIKLVTKSSFGCSDSVSKTITIKKVTTNFTFTNTCISKTTTFQNTADDVPVSSMWTFGNAGQSAEINPSITFPSTGTFPVKLVNTYAGCTDSLTKNVVIQNNPVANFTSGTSVSCKAPFNVNFRSNSPGATGWTWDFGDGSTPETIKNPTHLYSAVGKFSISLTVSTSGGCVGTVTKQDFINITEPVVSISNAPGGGCAPFNYSPIA